MDRPTEKSIDRTTDIMTDRPIDRTTNILMDRLIDRIMVDVQNLE